MFAECSIHTAGWHKCGLHGTFFGAGFAHSEYVIQELMSINNTGNVNFLRSVTYRCDADGNYVPIWKLAIGNHRAWMK